MTNKKDKIKPGGPMSYNYWEPVTPERAAEAKRQLDEYVKEREERLKNTSNN